MEAGTSFVLVRSLHMMPQRARNKTGRHLREDIPTSIEMPHSRACFACAAPMHITPLRTHVIAVPFCALSFPEPFCLVALHPMLASSGSTIDSWIMGFQQYSECWRLMCSVCSDADAEDPRRRWSQVCP